MTKIALIAGARPNFVKIRPLMFEMRKNKIPHFLINTGQHFDREMSSNFFEEFSIKPDYDINPRCNSPLKQFADILVGLENIFIKENPSLVVVVGDVNSTLAGAIAAKKVNVKLAHVEAGLRSGNYQMPEEYNRMLTDKLSDILFATSEDDVKNLKKENIRGKIFIVGNVIIDALISLKLGKKKKRERYYYCTLHRAENVDDKKTFENILNALEIMSKDCKIYLPLHPRTKKMALQFRLYGKLKKIFSLLLPLSHKESVEFQKNAALVLTDSGGVQEESSFLGIPCLTLRTETERPITLEYGTNTIAGNTEESILAAYKKKNLLVVKRRIPFWDGKTSVRIVKILKKET